MPNMSRNQWVEVEFDWDDIITKQLDKKDLLAIAKAINESGHSDAIINQLQEAIGGIKKVIAEKRLDEIIDDYVRGYPVEPLLRRCAIFDFNRTPPTTITVQ